MVHDELVLEVSANIVEDITHDLQQAMYEPMVEMVGGRIPIKVEITTGPTWGGDRPPDSDIPGQAAVAPGQGSATAVSEGRSQG